MTTSVPAVYHQTLESLFGVTWKERDNVVNLAKQKLKDDDLLIHIVVLAHGEDPSRIKSTGAMLRMLVNDIQDERIHIWLSYQGDCVPHRLDSYAVSHDVGLVEDAGLDILPESGKTENILRALKTIHEQSDVPADQQYVIFLDNDYVLYDSVNVHSLYIPWVLNPYLANGIPRSRLYVKAGGMRLKLSESLQSGSWYDNEARPASFIELCKESLRQAGCDPGALSGATDYIPTRDTLLGKLGESVVDDLEKALDLTTRQGARSSRGLSCYLQARRDKPVARFLSEFSFLLHGDQGTSLSNWMDACLTPGYGLELSFLNSALHHRGSAVVNVIGLPHAHHPKGETENFILGIEMFALLMDLIDHPRPAYTQFSFDDTWLYFSPTKLGLKRVAIKQPQKATFYQPLRELLKQEVVRA